jgi:hypothetical protein
MTTGSADDEDDGTDDVFIAKRRKEAKAVYPMN